MLQSTLFLAGEFVALRQVQGSAIIRMHMLWPLVGFQGLQFKRSAATCLIISLDKVHDDFFKVFVNDAVCGQAGPI